MQQAHVPRGHPPPQFAGSTACQPGHLMPVTLYTLEASTTPLSSTGDCRWPTKMVEIRDSIMLASDCSTRGTASDSSLCRGTRSGRASEGGGGGGGVGRLAALSLDAQASACCQHGSAAIAASTPSGLAASVCPRHGLAQVRLACLLSRHGQRALFIGFAAVGGALQRVKGGVAGKRSVAQRRHKRAARRVKRAAERATRACAGAECRAVGVSRAQQRRQIAERHGRALVSAAAPLRRSQRRQPLLPSVRV